MLRALMKKKKLLANQVLLMRSKEMKITVCRLGTVLRVIHNLSAVTKYAADA
jgi:hypothetical protein